MAGFKKLGISSKITEKLKRKGIVEATEIQEKSIPDILQGKDFIGKAKTGTGKTFAFILPIIQNIDRDNDNVQALIITPTRELAAQISREVKDIYDEEADVLLLMGGTDVFGQIRKLGRTPRIVIGTPGRIADHLERGTLNLGKINHLVLDEADQMLAMGFLNDVVSIISRTPKRRQTLLFSATIPNEIRKIARAYMKSPKEVEVGEREVTLDNIKQIIVETTDRRKFEDLCAILDEDNPFLAIIFCRTKARVAKLNMDLGMKGYNCDALHGDLSQAKRQRVMKNFRDMKLQYLVATDVAARGLDVEGVTHVINYDMPEDTVSYIHRIGRTGRAGEEGKAYTFVTDKNREQLSMLERKIRKSLTKWKR